MRVALYFDEDQAFKPSRLAGDRAVMEALLNGVPEQRRHVTVAAGTVIPPADIYNSPSKLRGLVDRLLGEEVPAWTTFDGDSLYSEFRSRCLCVFMVDGLTAKDSRTVDKSLRTFSAYRGALEARFDNDLNWAFYKLPLRYRVVENELRLFYRAYELAIEDNRDHDAFNIWIETGLFENVSWEDSSLRQTIFDPYSEVSYYRLSGELRSLVEGQLSHVVDEIFLRIAQLDPRLVQPFHGALKAFESLETADSMAHVAISVRRLMERFADVVYPPRDELVDGRKVGKAETKNRLWAYIAENVEPGTRRDVILASVSDVGNRIDSLHALANKGLHADIDAQETQRLLVGLVLVLYDILTLERPAKSPSMAPYEDGVWKFARGAIETKGQSERF